MIKFEKQTFIVPQMYAIHRLKKRDATEKMRENTFSIQR